jgi:hypothetical protein
MKRLLAYLFIVLGLGLTFNVSADIKFNKFKKGVLKELDINTSENSTKILIKNGYKSQCETAINADGFKMFSSTHFSSFKDKIKTDLSFIVQAEENGIFSVEYLTNILEDGSTGKTTFISDKFTGTNKFKKELKEMIKSLKFSGDLLFAKGTAFPEYGKTLTIKKKIYDGEKQFDFYMKPFLDSASKKQRKQLKKVFLEIKKNSSMELSKRFIGYSTVDGERYDLINWIFKIDYTGSKIEYTNILKELQYDQILFIHSNSGLPSLIVDLIPNAGSFKNDGSICSIYKNGTFISEISLRVLRDTYELKKTENSIAKIKKKEFKPKKTNQDNEAPVIVIAETIIVNKADYEFQGKVTDKAKTIYVEVDGRSAEVKKGKFTIKGYSPVDKQISITAIDQWGNKSTKLVKIKIKKEENIVKKLEPLNPLAIKSNTNDNKLALIIGIENYSDLVKASYADNDAQYFKDYAKNTLGIKNDNIKLLVDEEATFIKINKVLKKWLKSKVIPNKTELIIFYAGHGLATQDEDKQDLYLLPQNADTDMLSISSISRNNLFKEISNLNPKSVTIFFDACYSGTSRDNKSLIASARPVKILKNVEDNIPENFTIFSASQLNQMSSGLKNGENGIFSYYLMKGLEGLADQNKDKKITNGELQAYMKSNVSQKADEWGREQDPMLVGDPDKILMSYR